MNDNDKMKNTFYSERNKRYVEEIKKLFDSEILVKGFYGSVVIEIKVQDGIVQETIKDIRTKVIVSKDSPKDESKPNFEKKPTKTFNPPRLSSSDKTEVKVGVQDGN